MPVDVNRPTYQELLRRLAIADEHFLASILSENASGPRQGRAAAQAGSDKRTDRLVDLAVIVGADGSPTSIDAAVSAALDAGVMPEEIVEAILRLAPAVGTIRIVAVAPHVAAALGYDLWRDLETLDDARPAGLEPADRLG